MKEKHNNATINRPAGDRQLDGNHVKIDLPYYKKIIKEEEAWHINDRNAITVFKTENMCIVLVAMHKEAELIYHVAECVTSIQVLEGSLGFQTDESNDDLTSGDVVAIHDGYNYTLHAREESMFLLTMCYLRQVVL